MSRVRGGNVPVQGEDLVTCLRAFQEDCGCECRITIRLAARDSSDLLVEVQSYTDAGARIGLARELARWYSGHTRPLLTLCMMALHKVYHRTCELAHVEYKP